MPQDTVRNIVGSVNRVADMGGYWLVEVETRYGVETLKLDKNSVRSFTNWIGIKLPEESPKQHTFTVRNEWITGWR